MAQNLVDNWIPPYISPNLLTILGMICVMFPCFYVMVYPETEPKHYIIFTILFLTYQTLDNCDGKQARKLKIASPLGMALDHGCDSITLTFGIIIIVTYTKMDPFYALLCQTGFTLAFFLGNYEASFTGGLILPEINAPSEGGVTFASLFMIPYFFGDQILDSTFYGEKLSVQLIRFFLGVIFLNIL